MTEQAGSCPDQASLLALEKNELEGETAASVTLHLEMCGECLAAVLRHRKASRIISQLARVPQEELPAIPAGVRRRVFSRLAETESVDTRVSWFRRHLSVPVWSVVPVAALLLLATYPAWLHIQRFHQMQVRLADSDRPFSSLQILTLFGGVRSEQQLPEAKSTCRLVVLQLATLAELEHLDEFRVTVEDSTGRVLWNLDRLQPNPAGGGFLVAIPGELLPEGDITVILLGYQRGRELLREEYEFLVRD